MKITKNQLRQIIKETLSSVLKEQDAGEVETYPSVDAWSDIRYDSDPNLVFSMISDVDLDTERSYHPEDKASGPHSIDDKIAIYQNAAKNFEKGGDIEKSEEMWDHVNIMKAAWDEKSAQDDAERIASPEYAAAEQERVYKHGASESGAAGIQGPGTMHGAPPVDRISVTPGPSWEASLKAGTTEEEEEMLQDTGMQETLKRWKKLIK